MISPEYSIIVPAYNVAAYLPQCLDSLLKEQGSQVEVIVVDDCSTDQTAEILRRYAAAYPQLRVITHAENRGVSAARNTALDAAQGEYVLFVDADDRLQDGAIPALRALIEQPQPADIIHFQIRRVSEAGVVLSEMQGAEKYHDLRIAAEWRQAFASTIGSLLAWNGCYRRDMLNGLRFGPYCNGEDLLFALQAFCRASTIQVVPLVLYTYVQRDGSASQARTARHVRSVVAVCIEMMRVIQASGHYPEVRDLLFRKIRAIAEGPLLNTLLRLRGREKVECWDAWFDGLHPVFVGTDLVPRSHQWLYRMIFMLRSRTAVWLFLHFPLLIKKHVMRMDWFRRRWSAYRKLQP